MSDRSGFIDLNEGDLVRFLRADPQGGAGVDAGDVGIVINVSLYSYLILLGDPAYENYRHIPLDSSADWLSLQAPAALQGAAPRVWWSTHWREYQIEATKVIFRYWKDATPTTLFDVIAIFPECPSDTENWYNCEMFEHVGQHGGGDPDGVIRASRPASEAEYAELKRELESAPYFYRLKVYQRQTKQMREARHRAWLGQKDDAGEM